MTWEQPEVKHNIATRWNWTCSNPDYLKIGAFADIGCGCYFNAHQGIVIGERVQIGPHCSLVSVDTEDGVQGEITIGKNTRMVRDVGYFLM
jgi:serine acetyltransferase